MGSGRQAIPLPSIFLMPKRLPETFHQGSLELPPVFLDAYLTARAAAWRRAQQGCNCTENRNAVQTERLQEILALCLSGPFAKLRGGRGHFQGK